MTIAAALEREHRHIDGCIEAFLDDPDGAVEGLRTGLTALRRHIYLEEEYLFPPLRAVGLLMPVQVMLMEHGQLWRLTDTLLAAVETGDRQTATATARELLELLDRHNSKEEPVIYPHADVDLAPEAAAELDELIGSDTLPDGWVCERA